MNPILALVREIVMMGLESLGRYYSCYRAIVVDNQDPENLNRLKLLIPQVNGPKVHDYWAFPKNSFSGKDYGTQMLPRIGDVIWAEFEGGNVEVPIWGHGHRSKKEVPTDKELRDTDTFWFKSPKGNLVLINDTKNTIEIRAAKDTVISLVSDKRVNLGSAEPTNKAVLGDALLDYLSHLNNTLLEAKTTGGPFTPDTISKLTISLDKLKGILSDKVKLN